MPKGGHNAKPTALLKLTGQYREDRHGKRGDADLPTTDLRRMPAFRNAGAKRFWQDIVATFPPGVFRQVDHEQLRACCETYGVYRTLFDSGDIPGALKVQDSWVKLLAKLGLTPTDRTRLTAPDQKKSTGVGARKRG